MLAKSRVIARGKVFILHDIRCFRNSVAWIMALKMFIVHSWMSHATFRVLRQSAIRHINKVWLLSNLWHCLQHWWGLSLFSLESTESQLFLFFKMSWWRLTVRWRHAWNPWALQAPWPVLGHSQAVVEAENIIMVSCNVFEVLPRATLTQWLHHRL